MIILIMTGATAKRVCNVFRRLALETRATEIAEAAAVLPLMFMILLGIFWFGQAFSIYGAITRAAQEGARAGATVNCATCPGTTITQAESNAANAVNAALTASRLDPNLARYPVRDPALTACLGGGAPAPCSAGGNAHVCIQAPVQVNAPATSGVCGISVSFQYPFQFWFPFTSLNKQQILLNASALVRLENQ